MKKTSRSKPSVMAFYHEDGLVPAWKNATKFAGKSGRIATLPDIIEARLKTVPGAVPWETYFTTSSAEYMGKGKNGRYIIIVAHGIGPMATLDGALKAYSWQFKDKTRNRHGGRITQEEFLKLENGDYGKVEIVDLNNYLKCFYQYPFLQQIDFLSAMFDPLIKARLGSNTYNYIGHHRDQAIIWHQAQAEINPKNIYALIPGQEDLCRQYYKELCEQRKEMHLSQSNGLNPFILKLGGAAECGYEYNKPEEGYAYAHLLSIGRLIHVHHIKEDANGNRKGYVSLACDISCHGWNDGTRFVGIKAGTVVEDIHPEYDVNKIINKHWPSLMKPTDKEQDERFSIIMQVGKNWFSQHPKIGERMDTYEPKFLVTNIQPIGDPIMFETKEGGGFFFRYDIKEVGAIAPREANAYSVEGDPEKGRKGYEQVMIQFYKIQLDTTKKLPRRKEISNDYDKLMYLMFLEENDQ